MKGYKGFDENLCCRGFQYEIGKEYEFDGEIKLCNSGFHFCKDVPSINQYYNLQSSRICEIEATGDIIESDSYDNKCVTNKIKIIKELTHFEFTKLMNSGDCNSGDCNSGDFNSGNRNSGDFNSGNFNSGNRNSGDCNSGNFNSGNRNSGDFNSGNFNSGNRNSGNFNSGDFNSGNFNSGDCNSGDFNSGNRNSGDFNSGDFNSGNRNSGNFNSGNFNSGNRNSGNFNSGDFNSGDCNSGFFCSDEPFIRIFNKNTKLKRHEISFPSWLYFDLTLWVSYDTASDEEKEIHKKEIEIQGGFLKTLTYQEAFKHAWDCASIEDRKKLFDLPNWNNEIFKEISGIDAEKELKGK